MYIFELHLEVVMCIYIYIYISYSSGKTKNASGLFLMPSLSDC